MVYMSVQSLSDIVIRTATNHDKERIVGLVAGVLSEYGLQFDPYSTDADLNDIEANYLARGGIFEVIEDQEGKLVGTVGLYALDETNCELRKMYLAPEVRGLGLGRYILERTIDRARRSGFQSVTLDTAGVLKEAIRLYTRFGFTVIETKHPSARCDQSYILNLSK